MGRARRKHPGRGGCGGRKAPAGLGAVEMEPPRHPPHPPQEGPEKFTCCSMGKPLVKTEPLGVSAEWGVWKGPRLRPLGWHFCSLPVRL